MGVAVDAYAMLVSLVVGCLFVSAARIKLGNLRRFAGQVSDYHIVPERSVPVVAACIGVLELYIGVGLVFGVGMWGWSVAAAALLLVFTVALVWARVKHTAREGCGCLGGTRAPTWWMVGRTGLLTVLAVTVAVVRTEAAEGNLMLEVEGGVAVGLAAFGAALLTRLWEDLASSSRRYRRSTL